jgi:hypothetical protein
MVKLASEKLPGAVAGIADACGSCQFLSGCFVPCSGECIRAAEHSENDDHFAEITPQEVRG